MSYRAVTVGFLYIDQRFLICAVDYTDNIKALEQHRKLMTSTNNSRDTNPRLDSRSSDEDLK